VIEGVSVVPLRRIVDERGMVMHMLKRTDPQFTEFGEIYFSTVRPGVVKGWHLHDRMIINYAVVHGTIKLVLYDDREGSPTRGQLMELFIGDASYQLVSVPPGVWNGFKGVAEHPSIVANCASIPHDPAEIHRLPPDDPKIPYDWEIVHR
jgi:dTDP-4-dehydrorhamnose 3,5-epimerase